MKRKLNIMIGIETLNSRLNMSSANIENNTIGFKNATYTKKIAGRSLVSAQCTKFNLKEFLVENGYAKVIDKVKDGKQIKMLPDPHNNVIDDVFGFMIADKVTIDEETYNELTNEKKKIYKKSKNSYVANVTKKRTSRLQMNGLINVSNNKVKWEWNVASSSGDSMPYQTEVYSGVHTSILNLNIDDIGKFNVSNEPSEFRDYDELEGANVVDLTKDEILNRVECVLEGIEHLTISGNQTNYLTDTKPKFVILADYGWGNNAFMGVLNETGIDIETLRERILQNENYRMSNIYIGVNKFVDNKFNSIKEDLEELVEEFDFIKIGTVKESFEDYKKELRSNFIPS